MTKHTGPNARKPDSDRPEPVVVICPPHRASEADVRAAEAAAVDAGLRFVERDRRGVELICAEEGADAVVVVGESRRTVRLPAAAPGLDFHCSAGVLRVRNLWAGQTDPLVRFSSLQPGDVVLDCTAGQCADALVLAHMVGPAGRVLALESSRAIYCVISWGVAHHRRGEPGVDEALDRIRVLRADFREALAQMESNSVDIVYFDPMFRTPAAAPFGFQVFRAVADPRPLRAEDIEQARRVARKRVVVKDHRNAEVIHQLGLALVPGQRDNAAVRFGIAEATQ